MNVIKVDAREFGYMCGGFDPYNSAETAWRWNCANRNSRALDAKIRKAFRNTFGVIKAPKLSDDAVILCVAKAVAALAETKMIELRKI